MTSFSGVFTVEVDGRPILAFEASGTRRAQQLCKETWLNDDLTMLKSGGVSLRTANSELSVRPATTEEAIVFVRVAGTTKPNDDLTLAYLVNLDGGHEDDRRVVSG
jgi:hypothetical protein